MNIPLYMHVILTVATLGAWIPFYWVLKPLCWMVSLGSGNAKKEARAYFDEREAVIEKEKQEEEAVAVKEFYAAMAPELSHEESRTRAEEIYQNALALQDKGKHEKAKNLFRGAAELGHAESQVITGYKADDLEEAVKWYLKAAEKKHPEAQWWLGIHYREGWGVKKNYIEAVKWLRLAAEQGQPSAQKDLAETLKHLDVA